MAYKPRFLTFIQKNGKPIKFFTAVIFTIQEGEGYGTDILISKDIIISVKEDFDTVSKSIEELYDEMYNPS